MNTQFQDKNKIAKLRKEQHDLGRQKMQSEKYFESLEIFTNAFSKFGSHVLLLCDIVACYMILGRTHEGLAATATLQTELNIASKNLSNSTLCRCHVFIGKLLEEQAQLTDAMTSYQKGLSYADQDQPLKNLAEAQILRLSAFCDQNNIFEKLYLTCTRSNPESKNLSIELEHALVLSETKFVGLQSGLARISHILDNGNLLDTDNRLLVIDFVELLLLNNIEHTSFVKKYSHLIDINSLDKFEELVWQSATNSNFKLTLNELNIAAKETSLLSLIKLHLIALNFSDKKDATEILIKLNQILEKLPNKVEKILRKKNKTKTKSNEKLAFTHKENFLEFNKIQVKIKKDGQLIHILKKLSLVKTISTDHFIKEIFNIEYNEYSFDRARKSIERINDLLFKLTSIEKIISISKNKITLNTEIVLRNFST